jgi:hypothetical protein
MTCNQRPTPSCNAQYARVACGPRRERRFGFGDRSASETMTKVEKEPNLPVLSKKEN